MSTMTLITNVRLEANISTDSFRYKAMTSYNDVPGKVKKGSISTVKNNLKQWVMKMFLLTGPRDASI